MLGVVGDGSTVDHEQFVRDLFESEYGELVGLASLILGDRSAAEDVVQDVFAALYRRNRPLDDPKGAVGYLRRSVVNGARSNLRRRRLERRLTPTTTGHAASVEEATLAGDDARAVAAALAELPLRQRECAIAHHYLGLSHPEVAALLGISPGSVKTHLHRGAKRLAELLEDHRHG
jgi:RNA polymerase sigma-70 factor (sigma-E family)